MSGPYGDAQAAIEALWATEWAALAESAPIRWHHNTKEAVPVRATDPHWLHLAIEFDGERVVAYGGGRQANERELEGSVVIRSLASMGLGETECLRLLDAAIGCFRGRRVSGLSFIGEVTLRQPGAEEDGNWWIRSALVAFTYRFQG